MANASKLLSAIRVVFTINALAMPFIVWTTIDLVRRVWAWGLETDEPFVGLFGLFLSPVVAVGGAVIAVLFVLTNGLVLVADSTSKTSQPAASVLAVIVAAVWIPVFLVLSVFFLIPKFFLVTQTLLVGLGAAHFIMWRTSPNLPPPPQPQLEASPPPPGLSSS